MTSAPERPARRRIFRIAAVAGAAVVALVLVEVGLRVLLGARFVPGPPARRVEDVIGRHDRDVGWTLAPGMSTRVYGDGFAYDVALNSRGFRDVDRDAARRPGARRVVLLGDSYGFGWGVAAGETMGARLERDARVNAEIVNLCVPGYSTDQELWTLEREGPRLAPDVVLVLFCGNDLDGNETTNSHRMLKPRFVRAPKGVWQIENRPCIAILPVGGESTSWSELALSRLAIWQVVTGRAPLFAPRALVTPAAVRDESRRGESERVDLDSPTRHAFELLVLKARELSASVVVVVVPELGRPEATPGPIERQDVVYAMTAAITVLGARLGFETISVDLALRDAWREGRSVVVPDGHWNAEGHRLAAETVAPRLAAILDRRR